VQALDPKAGRHAACHTTPTYFSLLGLLSLPGPAGIDPQFLGYQSRPSTTRPSSAPDLHTATKAGPYFCSRVEIRCRRLTLRLEGTQRATLLLPQLHLILTQMALVHLFLTAHLFQEEITSARQACGIHLPKRLLQGKRMFELY
jgi:hypothetical protein